MAEDTSSAKHLDWAITEGAVSNAANVEAARHNIKINKWGKRAGWMTMNKSWEKFVAECSPTFWRGPQPSGMPKAPQEHFIDLCSWDIKPGLRV